VGDNTRGFGLDNLGAPYLAPLRRHTGIVAHVLRLKGSHAQTTPRQDAAKGGSKQTFARVGMGSQNHQSLRHHLPSSRFNMISPLPSFLALLGIPSLERELFASYTESSI
jgi:hypothetical protein